MNRNKHGFLNTRLVLLLTAAFCCLLLVSCGKGKEEPSRPAAPMAGEEASPAVDADVDLTGMSSTMVYSEVFNMVSAPEDYIGKKIRMSGMFNVYRDAESDRYYFACLILDATACCAQGIEFELAGEKRYPEDYPEKGEMITVAGTFDTYEENGYTYFTLRDAALG